MFGLPIAWLIGGAAVCIALFFGAVQIKHNAKLAAAHSTGVAVGKAEVAANTLEAAKKGADAEREAEAETPADADREYFKRLCAAHSSCRARAKYQAAYGGKQ